jgi:two-component sensor histidine kinase
MFPYQNMRTGTQQPSTNKLWYIVIMCALALMFVYDVLQAPPEDNPRFTAIAGVIDARRWDMQSVPVLNLSGEWRFSSQNAALNTPVEQPTYTEVPAPFQYRPAGDVSAKVGLYQLTFRLPPEDKRSTLALRIESIVSAHVVYVDGQLVAQSGLAVDESMQSFPLNRPYVININPRADQLDIAIMVANPGNAAKAGILRPVRIGDAIVLNSNFRFRDYFEFTLASVFLLIAMILILVRRVMPQYRGMVFLACFLAGLALFILTSAPSHKILYSLLPFDGEYAYTTQIRVYYVSIISYVFFLFFMDQHFPRTLDTRYRKVMTITGIACVFVILFGTIEFITTWEIVFFLYRFCVLIGFTFMILRIMKHDSSMVPYDVLLLYFSLFVFSGKNFFYYLQLDNSPQTPYVEVCVAVAVMIHIVLQTYRHAHQEQLKLAMAFHNARIKPHFLFNALNAIHDAIYEEPETAQELLLSFSQFLRNRFRFTDFSALVPLSEEVDILDAYLRIEHDRFRERIQIDRHIDPKALTFLVPQLLLQPLVENAIHHGVLKQRRGGTVTIRVSLNPSSTRLLVEVQDTGVGIAPEHIDAILHGVVQEGVGVLNIHSRLLHLYGQGLEIQSTVGEGTLVRCAIPQKGIHK